MQLANIPGPLIGLKSIHRIGVETIDFAATSFACVSKKVFNKKRYVTATFTQRWQSDVDHIDSIVQVLAKAAFSDRLGEVFVCRQNHTGVDRMGFGAAQLLELKLLQYSQEFDLHGLGGRSNLVQEQCATIGHLELTDFVVVCTGECTGNVPKQFAF